MRAERKNYHKVIRRSVKEILPDYRVSMNEEDILRNIEKHTLETKQRSKKFFIKK
ncbi:MAG: hypothetical protein PHR06_08070 [Candidatus Cloacimonetes bacterium]|nr:hypothetical protein [Candidatus Cloacimonadota bacterium]